MAIKGTVRKGELQEGQTALDATLSIEDMDNVAEQPQFPQLKTDLQGVVQKVKHTIEEKMRKRTLQAHAGVGDDVEVLEPADKRHDRDSK